MPSSRTCSRPGGGRFILRAVGAVLLAAAVNVLIVVLLAALNDRAAPDPETPADVRTILLASNRPPQPPPKPDEPEPQPPEPEPLVVNLDAPTPLPELEPLPTPLELPDPTFSPIRVNVPIRPTPAVPRKSQPQRQTLAAPQSSVRESAQAGPMDADRIDQPPRELQGNPQPTYPSAERRRGIEGDVVVKVLIDERGRVIDANVVRGRDGFAEAVLDVVRRWRFTPGRHRGKPVKVWGVKTIRFQLTN